MRRFLGTNDPVAITPNCSATPIGDITRPGISIALCNGNINPRSSDVTYVSIRTVGCEYNMIGFAEETPHS